MLSPTDKTKKFHELWMDESQLRANHLEDWSRFKLCACLALLAAGADPNENIVIPQGG